MTPTGIERLIAAYFAPIVLGFVFLIAVFIALGLISRLGRRRRYDDDDDG